MKIILNQDVKNLGEEGDVCEVARGYARNYLIPQGFAVPYTKKYIAIVESRRDAIEKRKEEKRKEALSLKERINESAITINVSAGETGKLFGSVTSAMIAEALAAQGIMVERKFIDLPNHHIKMVGDYSIKIKLYAQESADLEVKVVDPNAKVVAAPVKKEEAPAEEATEAATEEVVEEATEAATEEVVEEATAEAGEEAPAEEATEVATEEVVEEATAEAEEKTEA